MNYFISGCVFTAKFPELSRKIREYITARGDMKVLRSQLEGADLRG